MTIFHNLINFKISRQEAEELARRLRVPYVECSAKHRMNVDESFHNLVRLIRSVHLPICSHCYLSSHFIVIN